ncbi:S41 family peptidase [Chryseobacterium sp.]|uniref:S41 family peptidase n=1 Tax=Chryseobacterium sp. TaxID=1871047 RepID=UPI00321B2A91
MKFTIFFFALLTGQIGISGQKLSKKDVEDDLAYLYHSLQEAHYNLYAYKNKSSYDSLYQSLKSEIKDSMSMLETISTYQNLVSFADTGHCEIDFPAGSYIEYAKTGGTVFPIELAFENKKTFIRKNFSTNHQVGNGDQLISIDGIPIDDVLKEISPLISAERLYFKHSKIEFWSFPRLWFQKYGEKESWNLKIQTKNNLIINTQVRAITVMEYEEKRNGEIVDPKKSLKFYKNTAYLNPGSLSSPTSDQLNLFKKYIDSSFEKIKEKQSFNLIIDLRNNPGGDNDCSDYLISYFAKKPFKWYSKFSVKTSKILKEHTRKVTDTTNSFSQTILNGRDGDILPIEFPFYVPVQKSKKFRGKVFILINRQTYSMAAVSAALIQDYKFGTLVGEETGDTPTLYASQFSFHLPKTKIEVKIPKGYIIRPNGSTLLKGTVPNILIYDHLLDEKDEILNELLLKLKESI